MSQAPCTSLEPDARDFYRRSLLALNAAGADYLVGGAYAYARYTGIGRHTKDIDLFVRESDLEGVLGVLARAGYRTEVPFPHWLGKAFCGDHLVDVIHSSGNGVASVDDEWFDYAVEDEVLGVPVRLCPVEEMIWSKAFVMERERFDGADIMHLVRARGDGLDWARLVRRFGEHWRVLFSHLVLFGYVYPSEIGTVPRRVLIRMLRAVEREQVHPASSRRVCRGTLLSRAQFLVDVAEWAYEDARTDPEVRMTSEHIAQWTDAIADEVRTYDDRARNPATSGRG